MAMLAALTVSISRGRKMTSINDMYGGTGKSMHGEDLPPGLQVPVTIDKITPITFDDGKTKLELTFLNKQKVLLLNKTNAERIGEQLGEDYESWPGQVIYLHRDIVDFPGSQFHGKPCVRVVPKALLAPQPANAPKPVADVQETTATVAPDTPPSDEVPF